MSKSQDLRRALFLTMIVFLVMPFFNYAYAKNYILNGDFENLGVDPDYADKKKWNSDFSFNVDASIMYKGSCR